ncbi:sodium:dicarboxylate symporter [Chloropicon primus]|uniref:Amino acid transporter n=2 Tax=Chloropicon primus TaxID=1764295 RepID=A0A5B8MSW6_9CHLO|nr:sodium:dicarboxylate symporter [Chloropicon primus]UPR01721.1 sodium:dicarboxylate symporter [Chloropicon primus]|eukprot:QDZ22500.1 sodium:dicarboxylate symporter [Chloropicon primus]
MEGGRGNNNNNNSTSSSGATTTEEAYVDLNIEERDLLEHQHGHEGHGKVEVSVSSSGEHGDWNGSGDDRLTRKRGCMTWCGGGNMDPLLKWTLVGVVIGMFCGFVLNALKADEQLQQVVGFPGKVWLNSLKMLVLPLLSLSIVQGVSSLGKNKKAAGKVSRLTLGYYLLTTTTAVLIGIVVVNLIRPGYHSSHAAVDCHKHESASNEIDDHPQHEQSALESILQILEQAFPSNLVDAAANMNVLGVVSFSIFFGFVLSTMREEAVQINDLVDKLNLVVTRMVELVLKLTPVGVCSLITASIAESCDIGEMAQAIALYMVTVCIGLGLQGGLVLPALYSITTRKSPWVVLKGFASSLVTAFGTDSSSATLPVTLRCARELGYDSNIINFVLPLGATVNMNGTALYEALTVIFIAQRHSVDLSMAQMFVVVITGTMAAVGAAAIPSAGLVTMLMVLQAVNLSRFASDIALVITVDWMLDRLRTVVNVEGDAMGVAIIDHLLREQGQLEGGGVELSSAPRRVAAGDDDNL